MKVPPIWKIKRESMRLLRAICALPIRLWEVVWQRPRLEKMARASTMVSVGDLAMGPEVAIYLIYPSGGVLASHLGTLQHMVAMGISPVVVSNLPLSDADRAALKGVSTQVIERPNFGYDFGGYRDAILRLGPKLAQLDRLYILNDSAWMIDAPRSWFEDVRQLDVDFCGATSYYGIKRYDADAFRDLKWNYSAQHRNFHYASYALAMGPTLLRDDAFLAFWRAYPLSNKKQTAIARGEIGLSQWVIKRGFTHGATCSVQDLDKELSGLSPQQIDAVARHLVIPERPRIRHKKQDVLQTDALSAEGRADRIQIILTAVSAQAMGYVMPYYSLKYRGFQFVKKSPLWISQDGAETTLKILSQLTSPMGKQAYTEAKALVRSDTQT